MLNNLKIDHKILAKHFDKTSEAMRQLKRKHEAGNGGLWTVYVKAYNHDIENLENKSDSELLQLQAKLTGLLDERGILLIKEKFEDTTSFEACVSDVLDKNKKARK